MEWNERFAADKSEGTVLVLFVPSVDRQQKPIDQEYWETEALRTLGTCSEAPPPSHRVEVCGEMTNAAVNWCSTHR